jgi:NSS family neurotransmitter:Na+ symporter
MNTNHKNPRVHWGSRLGFIFAVAGSAVGLANVWRFPYLVGEHGGAAFILLYLLCLFIVGYPVLISEILIGRTTQSNPCEAFRKLGVSGGWGKLMILTGFIVSGFYSSVAAWILGYLVEACSGSLTGLGTQAQASGHFQTLLSCPIWTGGFHFGFMALSLILLSFGVKKGIERGTSVMMPLLFLILGFLVIKGLSLPGAWEGIAFLFEPRWDALKPSSFLVALGQAFFTLSLGQGTMITYGSYVDQKDHLLKSTFPVLLVDTLVSLLSAVAIFSIVAASGASPDQGPGLIFQTIPIVLSQISGGYLMGVLFFLLVFLAALTSQISAMEPAIAYLSEEWGLSRKKSVFSVGAGAFLLGLPCALSSNVLSSWAIGDKNILDFLADLCSQILIPLGGFISVVFVAWVWGLKSSMEELRVGSEDTFRRFPILNLYFTLCLRYVSPVLILLVFLYEMKFFSMVQ